MLVLTSRTLRALTILIVVLYVFDIPARLLDAVIWLEQIALLVIGLVLTDILLVITPGGKDRRQDAIGPGYLDGILAATCLLVYGYCAWTYEHQISMGYFDNPEGLALASLIILSIVEGTRRTAGWALIILLGLFLMYGLSAGQFPGMLQGRSISLEELLTYVVLDPGGLLGTAVTVVVTTVLAFVVFGAALFSLGGGQLFLDLATGSMRNIRGGTGKSSIIASSLFGSISGSAVGNVVTTGIVTIPLMKQSGYESREAAAVEAVASTGGQLLPPIMGSAAFIMADILDTPYRDIVRAAVVPALLFYLTLFMQVHFRALRRNIRAIESAETPAPFDTLRRFWPFLLPPGILLILLFTTTLLPEKIAFLTSVACLIAAFMTPQRPGWKAIAAIIDNAGAGMAGILPAVAVAGLVIGVLSVTGLGFSFGLGVVEHSGGNLYVLLGLTALASLVLGMGLPTTAVYILMASLVAPALVSAGIPALPAHLFVLYFGVLSMITPPVCLASIAAASISGSHFMATGMASVRLGISGFFVPFIFVLNPDLLSLSVLDPGWWRDLVCVVAGFVLLAAVIEDYFRSRLGLLIRAGLLLTAIMLFSGISDPVRGTTAIVIAALVVGVLVLRTGRQSA